MQEVLDHVSLRHQQEYLLLINLVSRYAKAKDEPPKPGEKQINFQGAHHGRQQRRRRAAARTRVDPDPVLRHGRIHEAACPASYGTRASRMS